MSKKHQRNQQNQQKYQSSIPTGNATRIPPPPAPAVPDGLKRDTEGAKTFSEKIGQVFQAALSRTTPEEQDAVTPGKPPDRIKLEDEWTKLVTAYRLLDAETKRHRDAAERVEKGKKALDDQVAEVQLEREELESQKAGLTDKVKELTASNEQINAREAEVSRKWPLVEEAERLKAELAEQVAAAKADVEASVRDRAEAAQLKQAAQQEKEEIDKMRLGLQRDRDEVQSRAAMQDARDLELLARERAVIGRETEAEAGFLGKNRAALAQLEDQRQILVTQMADDAARQIGQRAQSSTELAKERRQHEESLRILRQAAQTELDQLRDDELARLKRQEEAQQKRYEERFAELEIWNRRIQNDTNKLRIERTNLDAEKEALTAARTQIDILAAQKASAVVERLTAELNSTKEQYAMAAAERDRLRSLLNAREDADRYFNNRTPEQVKTYILELERQRGELQVALDGRPAAEAVVRLEALEKAQEEWVAQKAKLQRQLQESQRRLGDILPGAVEVETLTEEKNILNISLQRLKGNIAELKQEQEAAEAEAAKRQVFPECAQLDQSLEHQQDMVTDRDAVRDLRRLVGNLQQWIARDPDTKKDLYFSQADIRSFLGGMAMSHLMILQGISGIGKTSLPVRIARALGGGRSIVEVQAGWRDRHDLIGHYNSFRNEFHEGKFLRALYEAQCPAYKDRIYFVVLDEMNLSYPEQYFADLLSALEQPKPEDRRIELMARKLPQPPQHFAPDQQSLLITDNVWFIGTANQDETTRSIADKTYDRAHVLDLPSAYERFEINSNVTRPPMIHYPTLEETFGRAVDRPSNREAVQASLRYLDSLANPLRVHLGVGWGNRLAGQLDKYIPVVMDAGGTHGEALDYVLAMKILRKIRDRHDTTSEHLGDLKKKLETTYATFDPRYPTPVKSLSVVNGEIDRKLAHG